MRRYLRSYPMRHALSLAFAVLFAVIINYSFSYTKESWIIFTAFLVCQTTRGTPLRQGISYFFIIVMLAIVLPVHGSALMRDRVIDTLIGGLLGILFGQFIFPVKIYTEFSLGILPLLHALKNYSQAFSQTFLAYTTHKNLLIDKKRQIEAALVVKSNLYPEWVYEVGFNPGLRSGFRFFLVNLENVTEIFFSMNYLLSLGLDASLLSDFSPYVLEVTQKNEELFSVLIEYFSENRLVTIESETNFTSDMVELEKALNRLVPGNLDLLDISQDYITLTAIVRDLKDLRELLLQLVMALPPQGEQI